MTSGKRQIALRMAVVGFVVATIVPLLVGVVGYGDPWDEAIVTAVATGLGVSIVFYLFYSTVSEGQD